MARPKNQTERRAEIVRAAQRAINGRGVAGLRIKDVANEAALSVGLIHYYFPHMDELIFAVHRTFIEDFMARRKNLSATLLDPREQLVRRICLGLPVSIDDQVFRLFYELHSLAVRSDTHKELMSELWKEDVTGYKEIFETGQARKLFNMKAPVEDTAMQMVAFEDGLSVQLLSRNSYIDQQVATKIMTSFAEQATGCTLVIE